MSTSARPSLDRRRFLRMAASSAIAAPIVLRSPTTLSRVVTDAAEPQQAAQLQAGQHRVAVPGITADKQPLRINVSAGSVYQGGAFRLRVPGATSGTARLFGRTYPLTTDAQGPVGYVSIGVADPPGVTTLEVDAQDPVIGLHPMDRPITVLKTNWTVEYIWLPPGPGGGSGVDPAEVQAEIDLLAATYGGFTGRRWEEPWITPVNAPVTSYFGEQRSFNGGPVSGHHGGTDFGAPTGTPVVATNHGIVVVVKAVPVRGNMVIIDHGTGVYSGYAHLSAFDVTEGMTVQKGQVVGRIGSTGLSTGPHLHWELSVMGVLVDGLRWLDGTQGF